MMKKYRVVIIGFAHMHINDVARYFYECERTEIIACADTPHSVDETCRMPYTRGWNFEFCKKSFHIPRVYEDWVEMLDLEKPDLALITSENDMHVLIVEECAKRHIHVCIEKPMAISLSAAMRIQRAARQGNISAMVDWPFVWNPAYHELKKQIDAGKIGRVLQFKIRTAHTGPLGTGAKHKGVDATGETLTDNEKAKTWWHQARRGGGSMLDFCCYGSIFSRWLIGEEPIAAFGMRANLNSEYGDADDNAVLLVQYPKAYANIETSWTTPCELLPNDFPMIYGSNGSITIISTQQGEYVKLLQPGEEAQMIEPSTLPKGLKNIAYAWVEHFDKGISVHETLQMPLNLAAMRILDAGLRASESGHIEILRNESWQIG